MVWSSLTGPHGRLAQVAPGARRYPAAMSPFGALDPVLFDPARRIAAWAALAELVGPGGPVTLTGGPDTVADLPPGWMLTLQLPGVQMVATDALVGAPDPEAVLLQEADVPEMLDLVRRTRPGPFGPRTRELGRYLGLRRDGVLVAMAGERLHPPGYTEISAVCTDPAFRGQGLAARLIRAVAQGVRERGEIPMLHAAATNTGAVRLYESLGFVIRRRPDFFFLQAPA